jgi:hypothetical protein
MSKRYRVLESSSWNPNVEVRFETDSLEELREWWRTAAISVHTLVEDTHAEKKD